MTAWIKYTRTALLTATFCLFGLALGTGCNKGDEGEDRGNTAKERNRNRYREPIRDKPVQGEEGARLVVPGRTAHA
jgi:hypothetical protein